MPDLSTAADLVDVPESPEVVAQTIKDLTSLYLRVCRGGGRPYRDGLISALTRLSQQPGRALQVALALTDRVVTPIRPTLDLSDPREGIFFTADDEPTDGEFTAAVFVNHILRRDYAEARDSFAQLVQVAGAEEVANFLGLLLAISATK